MDTKKKHIYKGQIFKIDRILHEDIEKNKLSLPGSPLWDIYMNPGCLPDGDFSKEKRKEFDIGIKKIVLKSQMTNKTFIENMVDRKRKEIGISSI